MIQQTIFPLEKVKVASLKKGKIIAFIVIGISMLTYFYWEDINSIWKRLINQDQKNISE